MRFYRLLPLLLITFWIQTSSAFDYAVFPITKLEIINTAAKVNPDPKLKVNPNELSMSDGSRVDIVTSGTFYWKSIPLGMIIRRGEIDSPQQKLNEQARSKLLKVERRAAVAVLENGEISLCRPDSMTIENVNKTCSHDDLQIMEYLSGGAMIINGGMEVCTGTSLTEPACKDDLYAIQKFTQNGNGINAEQFYNTKHTLFGMKDKRVYVLWPLSAKNGKQMQTDLIAAGFEKVIKFDGGNGFFAITENETFGRGSNITGLKLQTAPLF